jgi:hypothetical protein
VAGDERLGALASDGHAYVQPTTPYGHGLQLVDPQTGTAERVPGPSVFPRGDGDESWYDLGWAPDGDLLIVTDYSGNSRSLSRCGPDGSGCRGVLSDPTGTVWLGGVPR